MKEVSDLFERLDKAEDIDGIRLDIANFIARTLAAKRETLGFWEKAQFAHAIAALAHNVYGASRDSTVWLRLCLVCIENAHTPPEKRSEDYTPRNKQIEALTFEQLMDDIRKLGGHGS